MVDLVSFLFVKSLGLSLCTRKKHQHIIPDLEEVGEMNSKIYRIYHLKLYIID